MPGDGLGAVVTAAIAAQVLQQVKEATPRDAVLRPADGSGGEQRPAGRVVVADQVLEHQGQAVDAMGRR